MLKSSEHMVHDEGGTRDIDYGSRDTSHIRVGMGMC
jgi:hypothetical protein